jgi:hypothetical protein
MPVEQEIGIEKERLYESAALRDDLNDAEATVLLKWGETEIERLALLFPDELEQKARFLRQVIKHINRFVGQREFNQLEGQKEYLSKIFPYLPQLGWASIDEMIFFAAMPQDPKDMMGTLMAILNTLTPPVASPDPLPAPTEPPLENPDAHSINQSAHSPVSGENTPYGEEK